MKPIRVLFLCVRNTARSQIAEEYMKIYGGEVFDVLSAGMEPGPLNPYVIRLLKENDIDIADKKARAASELYSQGETFDYYISLCQDYEELCPKDFTVDDRYKWAFKDPETFTGTDEEIMVQVRELGRQIRDRIIRFIFEICSEEEKEHLPEITLKLAV
jgi:arsenate reductase